MAAVYASKGFDVIGLDRDARTVSVINDGRAPVAEPGLPELVARAKGRLKATRDYGQAIAQSEVTFVIVPTPSRPDATFSNAHLIDALQGIGSALRAKRGYHLVVVTSTVMPGAMAGELTDCLEQASGRKVGADLGLCYSPEFIALGSVVHDLMFPDMILIGESDPKAGALLEEIYAVVIESKPEIHRMSLVNAELTKISVNTYVTTKISYANMIADLCDHLPGADAGVVTRAVGADSRIGRKYLKPAIGYGGPCFPRDNKAFAALGHQLGVDCSLASATDRINERQLTRLHAAVAAHATAGDVIAVLGLAYKPATDVIEESQGVALAAQLYRRGHRVVVCDPLAVPRARAVLEPGIACFEIAAEAIAAADVVVVTTPWPQFAKVPAQVWVRSTRPRVVIDPWGVVAGGAFGPGLEVVTLGTGSWKFERSPRLGTNSQAGATS